MFNLSVKNYVNIRQIAEVIASFSPTDKLTRNKQNFSFVEGYFVLSVSLGV